MADNLQTYIYNLHRAQTSLQEEGEIHLQRGRDTLAIRADIILKARSPG